MIDHDATLGAACDGVSADAAATEVGEVEAAARIPHMVCQHPCAVAVSDLDGGDRAAHIVARDEVTVRLLVVACGQEDAVVQPKVVRHDLVPSGSRC